MFTNRFSKVVIALIVVAVALATASMIPAGFTPVSVVESKEQTLREYQLGERYGVLPQNVALFSAKQILREYFLGERYGQMPQSSALVPSVELNNALTAYHLGEKVIAGNALESAMLDYRRGEKAAYATNSDISATLWAYHLGEKEMVNSADSAWMTHILGEKDIK